MTENSIGNPMITMTRPPGEPKPVPDIRQIAQEQLARNDVPLPITAHRRIPIEGTGGGVRGTTSIDGAKVNTTSPLTDQDPEDPR